MASHLALVRLMLIPLILQIHGRGVPILDQFAPLDVIQHHLHLSFGVEEVEDLQTHQVVKGLFSLALHASDLVHCV